MPVPRLRLVLAPWGRPMLVPYPPPMLVRVLVLVLVPSYRPKRMLVPVRWRRPNSGPARARRQARGCAWAKDRLSRSTETWV